MSASLPPPWRPFISGEALCSCLQACIRTKNLADARIAHSAAVTASLDTVPELRVLLIQVYAHGGSLAEAHSVFARTPQPTSHTWHAIISAHVKLGVPSRAFSLYKAMQKQGGTPNKWIFLCVIKACSNTELLEQGMHAHKEIIKFGMEYDVFISTTLVHMYVKCGHLQEGHKVFLQCPHSDAALWGALISGYVQQGQDLRALELFASMQQKGHNPDRFTYSCILKALGNLRALWQGMEIHSEIVSRRFDWDHVIGSTLVDTYAKCGALPEARKVFDSLPLRDNVLWGSMIAGYAQHAHGFDALNLFGKCMTQGIKPDKVMYTSALKSCASIEDPMYGRLLHELFMKTGLYQDEAIGNALIDMYSSWKSLKDAQQVFKGMKRRSVVTCNAMIATYADHQHADQSIEVFKRMQYEGISIDTISVTNTLKACNAACTLEEGRYIHDYAVKISVESGGMVANTLIDMYAKCGSLDEAFAVYDGIVNKDIVSWNAMVSGCVHCGHAHFALTLFAGMHESGLQPDSFTYSSIAKACGDVITWREGFLVHLIILDCNRVLDLSVGSALIDMYCKLGFIEEASRLFNLLLNKNVVTWNSMIAGYAQQGLALPALQTFQRMTEQEVMPDAITYVCALKACGMLGGAVEGRQIHNKVVVGRHDSDSLVANTLVDMYAKCASISEAHCIFDSLSHKNLVSWNAMIGGFCKLNSGEKVFDCFKAMQLAGIQPDEVTFSILVKACTVMKMIKAGQLSHVRIVNLGLELNPIVSGALLDMYANDGLLDEAHKVLQSLASSDLVSSNELVAGYVNYGFARPALSFFKEMQGGSLQPDKITYSSILRACSDREDLEQGRVIHHLMTRSGTTLDEVAGSTLIDMYSKCGSLTEARQVFDEWPHCDIVMWSAMIGGYVQHNQFLLALELFSAFLQEGLQPDQVIFSFALKASGRIGAVANGFVLHDQVVRLGFELDSTVRSSLIDMYGKLGSLQEASKVLRGSENPTLESWTAMIAGYAEQGNFEWAQRILDTMHQQGFKPDERTYGSILTCCSHAAKVDEGQQHFRCMVQRSGVGPSIEHFNGLIDLLGRAGCLDVAEKLLRTLPPADVFAGWVALLSACKTFGDNRLGRHCFKQLAQWKSAGLLSPALASCIETGLGWRDDLLEIDDFAALNRSEGICLESDEPLTKFDLIDEVLDRKIMVGKYPVPMPFPRHSNTSVTNLKTLALCTL